MDKFGMSGRLGQMGQEQDYANHVGLGYRPSDPVAPPARMTLFDVIVEMSAQSQAVSARAEMLADKLCGPVPTSNGGGEVKTSPATGLFEAATNEMADIQDRIRRINYALNRIEDLLP